LEALVQIFPSCASSIQDCIDQLKTVLHIGAPKSLPSPQELRLAPMFKQIKTDHGTALLQHLASVMLPQEKGITSVPRLLEQIQVRRDTYTVTQLRFSIRAVSALACGKTGQSKFSAKNEEFLVTCSVCSLNQVGETLTKFDCPTELLLNAALHMSASRLVQTKSDLRMDLIRTLSCVVTHSDGFSSFALATTPTLTKYIAKSLRDASRHVRVLAGKLIGKFFQYSAREDEEKILFANRRITMELLQRINDPKLFETTLFAWIEIAKTAAPADMLPLLGQLVDYLSFSNMLIRQSAVVGLQNLAEHAGCTIWALFSPYMRQISMQVCRKCQAQPQFISVFASLMGKLACPRCLG
jgi:hypothetical protein